MEIDISTDTGPMDQDDVVRWVPSQCPNPALQALMREAEREKRARPATPYVEPFSWSHTAMASSSAWLQSTRTSSLPSLSASSSTDSSSASLSTSALHAHGSEDSSMTASGRGKPPSYSHAHAQRKPLSASTSSANQAVRLSRPRSSSHSASTSSKNSTAPPSKRRITEDDPDATAFLALLRDVSRQVDENSKKKQKVAAKVRERVSISSRPNAATTASIPDNSPNGTNLRAFVETSSASCISGTSTSTSSRTLTRTVSLGASATGNSGTVASGSNSKVVPMSVPRVFTKTSSAFDVIPLAHSTSKSTSGRYHGDGDRGLDEKTTSGMRNTAIDIDTHHDDEWDGEGDRAMSVDTSTIDLQESMQIDDSASSKDEADTAMDVSFFQPPPTLLLPKKLSETKPGFTSEPEPPTTQRLLSHRPPPLGMRRPALLSGATQPSSSQYSLSQVSRTKGTVPRFKPPLLSGANGNKSSDSSRASSSNIDRRSRGVSLTRLNGDSVRVSGTGSNHTFACHQDPDSSFDVSFDVDGDALEETMRAYD